MSTEAGSKPIRNKFHAWVARFLFLLALMELPIAVRVQFNYMTNDSAITITGYTGSDSAVDIPSTK